MTKLTSGLVVAGMAALSFLGCTREILGPNGQPLDFGNGGAAPGTGGSHPGTSGSGYDVSSSGCAPGVACVTTGSVYGVTTVGPTTGVTTNVSTGSTPQCGYYAIYGQLTEMSGTATSSTGGGVICDDLYGDQADHEWESDCTQDGCDCKYDYVTACSCTFPNHDGCNHNTCCPYPWGPH